LSNHFDSDALPWREERIMKNLIRPFVALAAVALLVGVVAASRGSASASVTCTSAATDYTWRGTVPAYGIRDYSIDYCGPDSLDLYAGVHWKGNRALSLVLIAPDGSQSLYTGSRSIGGEVSGPLASGTWTIVVRNDTSSNVSFSAEMALEQ
jgi:hypothetical protein